MNNRITPEKITSLNLREFFVYGANELGIHGAGAAKDATKWGAIYGRIGFSGQTYGIPTKSTPYKSLPLNKIQHYVDVFLDEVVKHPDFTFFITPIGCNRAGFSPEQIAPMFKDCVELDNVWLPQSFWNVLLNNNNVLLTNENVNV